MMDVTAHIGYLRIDLFIPGSHSLKDKRMVTKKLRNKIRDKYNVSVSELDNLDKWQVAAFGFIMLGNDKQYIDKTLQHLLSYVDAYHAAEITNSQLEFI